MKYVVTILLLCFLLCGAVGQENQDNAQHYSLCVAGRVVFKKYQSQHGATVYVMWNEPINGRIPWVHAKSDGTFSIEFSRIADVYRICAHAGQTNGFLPLARTPEAAKKIRDRLFCSDSFPLDEQHLEKRDVVVNLK